MELKGKRAMTERELKRLSRVELLGLLLDEVKRNDALEAQLKDLQDRLAERTLFEEAKTASEQCMQSVQGLGEKQDVLFQKLTAQVPTSEDWQRMNERIENIMREQKAIRSMITSLWKGANR